MLGHSFYNKTDDDFYYFLGRWVCLRLRKDECYGVGIAFHFDDIESINWFVNYFARYKNLETSCCKHKTKDLIQLYVYNKSLVEKMIELFPDYKDTADTKSYPAFFRNFNSA